MNSLLPKNKNELNEQFFFPEVLIQVDKDTYVYSLDEVLSDFTYENKIEFLKFIEKLPKSLLWKKQEEIKNTQITMSDYHQDDEDALKSFSGVETCNDKLINVLKINNQKRKKNKKESSLKQCKAKMHLFCSKP